MDAEGNNGGIVGATKLQSETITAGAMPEASYYPVAGSGRILTVDTFGIGGSFLPILPRSGKKCSAFRIGGVLSSVLEPAPSQPDGSRGLELQRLDVSFSCT